MRTSYLRMVAHIALDSLNRAEAIPLLVQHYLAAQSASLLLGIKEAFGGPDLMALLDPSKQPLSVVLDWFDENEGRDLARRTFPESPVPTGRIGSWSAVGRMARSDLSSIQRFVNAVSHRGAIDSAQTPNLRRWMIVARALAWLEKECPFPFRTFLRRHLLLGLPEIDIGRELSLMNIEGKTISGAKDAGPDSLSGLEAHNAKAFGDQAAARDELAVFQRLCEEQDPEGQTGSILPGCSDTGACCTPASFTMRCPLRGGRGTRKLPRWRPAEADRRGGTRTCGVHWWEEAAAQAPEAPRHRFRTVLRPAKR